MSISGLYPRRLLAAPVLVTLAASLLSACNFDLGFGPETQRRVVVEIGIRHQTIDGFGGSNAWQSLPADSTISNQLVSLLYSSESGIGLSILRTRIPFRDNPGDYRDAFVLTDPDGQYLVTVDASGAKHFELDWSAWEIANTRALITAILNLPDGPPGLTVMSTPWTPPNRWKIGYPESEFPAYGGTLDPDRYADYADLLANYVEEYEANMGVPLSVLSMQNEPNYVPTTYESCGWSATEIRTFLQVLSARFENSGISGHVAVMAAEDMHFEEDLVLPALADPTANAMVDIIGVHQYDNANPQEDNLAAKSLPNVVANGKRLWMTEVSSSEANDSTIEDGLYWARVIHNDLVVGNVNAFLYWWLWSAGSTRGSLVNIGDSSLVDNKRLYTLGQYSRFVRPGWHRVEMPSEPLPGIDTSAFSDESGHAFAVVVINENETSASLTVDFSGVNSIGDVRAFRTSESESLEQIPAPQHFDAGFTLVIAPRSVTTVTGTTE